MGKISEGYWELKNYSRSAGDYSSVGCYKDPIAACKVKDLKAWASVGPGKYEPYDAKKHQAARRVECASSASNAAGDTYFTVFRYNELQRELELTAKDVQDIAIVTSTEVDTRLDEEVWKQQLAAVVDTILNRIYLARGDVRGVLEKPFAFSAIVGPAKAYGGIDKVPPKEVTADKVRETYLHLQARANGKPSIVGGHFNYFNPHKSEPSWGPDVMAQAHKEKLIFGSGDMIHYHGTAKGERKAPAFKLKLPVPFVMPK